MKVGINYLYSAIRSGCRVF